MEQGYKPPPDFGAEIREPLVDISVTDSTELWLLKWPSNQFQPDDFQGKQLKVNLHRNGKLATIEDRSGKSYDLVSFSAHEPAAMVLMSSKSVSKVVDKISRQVSFIHYPGPADFKDPGSSSRPSGSIQRSGGPSRTHSHNMTPVGSARMRSMSYGIATPTSTKERDSGFVSGTSYESHSKKRRVDGSSPSRGRARSSDRSTRESGLSSLSVGASGLSSASKSKNKIKVEEE